jgi:hypothetical protein
MNLYAFPDSIQKNDKHNQGRKITNVYRDGNNGQPATNTAGKYGLGGMG